MKCCSNFNHSNSDFLTFGNVTVPPTVFFPVKTHFIFTNKSQNKDRHNQQFLKITKTLTINNLTNTKLFDLVIDKALKINLVYNSSIPTSGGLLACTVSNTGHSSFGDFRNSGP